MKGLLGLLLVANLAFFAFMQWGSAWMGEAKGLQAQPPLNAEKIKLMRVPAAPPVAAPPMACMEWGEFSGSDLARASTALAAMNLGDRLTQRQTEHAGGYWVYMPPQKTHAEVEKKVAELKALGVEEYFVVQDAGQWQNAISLGIFKTGEAARKFLGSLKAQGVKSAVAGERMSKIKFTVFVLKSPDAALTAKMAALQKDFADSELKAAACAN